MEEAKQIQDEESNSEEPRLRSLSKIGQSTRRGSIKEAFLKLDWLKRNFRDFEPSCWWMGIFELVRRLCQTSLMVLCRTQSLQTSLAAVLSLVFIIVQREASPYRHSSE
jgi:hypothetical protein